jgi:hypothetical protein
VPGTASPRWVAGSRKSEEIIDLALAETAGRVLITTYTNENRAQIERRIAQRVLTRAQASETAPMCDSIPQEMAYT